MQALTAFAPHLCQEFQLSADLKQNGAGILAEYVLEGQLDLLYLSPEAEFPQFRDELWKTTCFEVFLKCVDQPEYLEWNFSVSKDWAQYYFIGYRERGPFDYSTEAERPEISWRKTAHQLHISVEIPMALLQRLGPARTYHYGLTAVLHNKKNERHYWALAHAGPKPDFHDARSFTGRLDLRNS